MFSQPNVKSKKNKMKFNKGITISGGVITSNCAYLKDLGKCNPLGQNSSSTVFQKVFKNGGKFAPHSPE